MDYVFSIVLKTGTSQPVRPVQLGTSYSLNLILIKDPIAHTKRLFQLNWPILGPTDDPN